MTVTVTAGSLTAARRTAERLRDAAAGLHDALPADDAGRLVADEAATLARGARHGLTRTLRLLEPAESRLPATLRATAVRGLGTSAEYGSTRRNEYSTYTRRGHRVRRRTRRQLPPPARAGYVVGPALKRALPKIADRWQHAAGEHFDTTLGG